MSKESFPIIDPLTAGHALAEKELKRKAQKELEKEIDLHVSLEEEEEKINLEKKLAELEEIYGKNDDESVMDDIDPSRRKN